MPADKVQPDGVGIAHDDLLGRFQPHALKGADTSGPRAKNQHGVSRRDSGDIRSPVACGQHIPHQEGLQVGDAVGNPAQALIGIGDPDILRLSAVDAAAQRPAAVRVGAVVDPAMPAEEACSTEGLHIHRHPVPGLNGGDSGAHLLHDAHHFMAHRDAGDGPGHRAVLDVQIAGADAGQGHPDDGVPVVKQCGLGLVQKGKSALFQVGIGKHRIHLEVIISVWRRKSNLVWRLGN